MKKVNTAKKLGRKFRKKLKRKRVANGHLKEYRKKILLSK